MMKFTVNHPDKFTNVYPAFIIGYMFAMIAIIIELNVMVILSTIPSVFNVINKYISLIAIANIPRYYFSSILEHKILAAGGKKIKIMNFRHQNKLKD